MQLQGVSLKLAFGFFLSFAAMAYGAEMPYLDMLKPDMVFVDGAQAAIPKILRNDNCRVNGNCDAIGNRQFGTGGCMRSLKASQPF